MEACLLIRCLAMYVLLLRGIVFTDVLPSNISICHNVLCLGRQLNQAHRGYISSFKASVKLLGGRHFVKGTCHCCGITFHYSDRSRVWKSPASGKRKSTCYAAQCSAGESEFNHNSTRSGRRPTLHVLLFPFRSLNVFRRKEYFNHRFRITLLLYFLLLNHINPLKPSGYYMYHMI
jgi:hypothetical protein